MSIIEQIKAEIESWLREYAEDSQFELGERYGYKRLLSFLSTLESEKPRNSSGNSEIPKELKEASEKEYPCNKSWMTDSMLDMNAHCQVAFWKGAKWQKEQMMQEAISCKVFWHDGPLLDYTQEQQDNALERIGANVGDKVRLIIVKED